MKKILIYIACFFLATTTFAQETILPANAQSEPIALTNATIHTGTGEIINNGNIIFRNGKITSVSTNPITEKIKIIDCSGKHIYPGLILAATQLGLLEVPSVRATVDASEIGDINSNISSLVAYNTDSKAINPLHSMGILLANVVPAGGIISGSSSVVQLDAWNWEDAAYATENAIIFRMPSLLIRRGGGRGGFGGVQPPADPIKSGLEKIENVKIFFREAKAYSEQTNHENVNLKLEAVKGLFNKKQKLFIYCNIVKEMLIAIDFAKEFGFDVTLVGAVDSWQIADILKENNISVILNQLHELPAMIDDDIDQPFKTPGILQKAGVLFCITIDDGNTQIRNLAFNAGTAATYGLSKEQALTAITLNAAKILGIENKTGSIEVNKDANLVISSGDILDMKSSNISSAYIQGRQIDMANKQSQLYEKYKTKYGIK